jgi:hypothetical protein
MWQPKRAPRFHTFSAIEHFSETKFQGQQYATQQLEWDLFPGSRGVQIGGAEILVDSGLRLIPGNQLHVYLSESPRGNSERARGYSTVTRIPSGDFPVRRHMRLRARSHVASSDLVQVEVSAQSRFWWIRWRLPSRKHFGRFPGNVVGSAGMFSHRGWYMFKHSAKRVFRFSGLHRR